MGKNLILKTAAGAGKHRVQLLLLPVGEDILAVFFGGDRPHVGAVAVAIPRPSLRDPSRLSATSSVFTLVGHKDDEVARMASERLARELNRVAVVACGIHVEKATRADIGKLVQNAKLSLEKAINSLKKGAGQA